MYNERFPAVPENVAAHELCHIGLDQSTTPLRSRYSAATLSISPCARFMRALVSVVADSFFLGVLRNVMTAPQAHLPYNPCLCPWTEDGAFS